MKQKYTLLIADMEISVITDESQASVEHIVGILDRKMREIMLKSKRCSKNEAALLCALDFCAEKLQTKEKVESLESQLGDALATVEELSEKVELLTANINRLERENQKLEAQNRSIWEETTPIGAVEEVVEEVVEETTEEVEAIEEAVEVEEQLTIDAPIEEAPAEEKKPSRNRVGSMFDLLTFTDI